MTTKTSLACAFEKAFPEIQIFLRRPTGTRFLTLSPARQCALALFAFVFVFWTFVATAALLISTLWGDTSDLQTAVLSDAYEDRLAALSSESDTYAADAARMRSRFYTALEQVSAQQKALLDEMQARGKLASSLKIAQSKLDEAIVARKTAEADSEALTAELAQIVATLDARVGNKQDLSDTLNTISLALADAVRNRDAAHREIADLEETLARFEINVKVNTERQNLMLTRLEEAVAMSFEPLDKMFENAGIDVDGLMAQVRRNYSGTGGPLLPAAISTKSEPGAAIPENPELETSFRFNELLMDLETLNLTRIAVMQVPLAMPVKARFRYTSKFGMRSDPKTGGRKMHKGVDMAGPKGTPILATADGKVIFAGVQSGFGKFIKIRHSSGYVTAFAHLDSIDVKQGQIVTRGEQIGRMGSSGRSTGSHLHYEVRLDGKNMNPMTYLKAAQNVY